MGKLKRARIKALFIILLTATIFFPVIPTVLGSSGYQTLSSHGMIKYDEDNANWLHTDGRWIKDESGNIVELKGAGLSDIVYDVGFSWYRHHEVPATYDWLKRIGVNLVRQQINMLYWNDNINVTDVNGVTKTYQQLVDDIVQWCLERGIYVELDWASDRQEMMQDAKKPYLQDPVGSGWIDFLVELATRYKDYPNVWICPMNEPPATVTEWRNAVSQAIQGIRSVAPNIMILVQPSTATWNPVDDFSGNLLPFPNIVYGYHHYYYADLGSLAGYDWPPNPYAQAYHNGRLEEAKALLEQKLVNECFRLMDEGVPVVVDEFGVDTGDDENPRPNWDVEIKDLYEIMNKYKVPFAQWAWHGEWDINPDPNRRIKNTMLYGDCSKLNILGELFVDYSGVKPPTA